jgi:hypothetical protein
MPVSGEAFDPVPDDVNTELLALFIQHPNLAYTVAQLKKKFGDDVSNDIFLLLFLRKIEMIFKKGDYRYRLKTP